MTWYTFDTEVFAHNWIAVFKNRETGAYSIFHNDNKGVKDFITDDAIYCGFNSKGYDQYIIKAICSGFSPEEIKVVSEWIIHGGQGWECPLLDGVYYRFNNVDIADDLQRGLSLKAIEGHLGMDIQESEVDFNLDRPLTQEELESTIFYCKHDVDATEHLTNIRKDYLQTKLNLGQRADVDSVKALSSTNAKLTAMMLKAKKQVWTDGREYVYPPNLDLDLIPQDVLEFFNTIHDLSIPDDDLFDTFFETTLGGMPCKYAWGGVHGSLTGYYEESTEDRIIQNRDVSSLYPSLIELYNYLSRNVPDAQIFYDIRKDRIAAKHNGDKQLANDLKLPLNTVSGAQENRYNDLYDPLPTRSLRISGQLFLTMLAVSLLRGCKTIKLLNFNTDGLMYSVDKTELPIVDKICSDWEKQTKFELETDDIRKVWIKDVNNLLLIKTDGKVKTVGGYLNYGISVKGAWSVNNNATIIKKALIEYFVNDTPVEDTINSCDDILAFQLIAKAGNKYKEAYHLIDGEKYPVQKVNRVYATADTRYGKLFKVKSEDDSTAKIEMLPEHCIIDNSNKLTTADIDKSFYIEVAKKRINDYLGIKPEKNKRRKTQMATTTTKNENKTLNVYQKLLKARMMFLNSATKKSGKNISLSFKYFELEDIVPVATPIFEEVGLLPVPSISDNTAVLNVIDIDNPADFITFTLPFTVISGNKAVNEVQAVGASITYYRRYLYMVALDIIEADGIEPNLGQPTPPSTPTVKANNNIISLAPTQTKPLTDATGNASDLQIKQMKELLKTLREKDPSKEEWIAEIAVATNGFTVITKADCEATIVKINEMLNGGNK